jgi:hypothetical protein
MVNTSQYSMGEKIERVFYHELGHFVARQLNKIYFEGTSVKRILLYPCQEKRDMYCGRTDVHQEEGKPNPKEPPTRKQLAEILASQMYGCMFQAYFMKQSFVGCLTVNGTEDLDFRRSSLEINGLYWERDFFSEVEDAYFDQLVNGNLLEGFRVCNHERYLKEYATNQYEVIIGELQQHLEAAIEAHASIYKSFISKIEAVIAENLDAKDKRERG